MPDVILTYSAPEGSKEISVTGGKLSFGRGSEADIRFADDGLSRLNSTVYREGERVWIVDENSTNGTFVNGAPVAGAGTPLKNGDTIRIGHRTDIKVRIAAAATDGSPTKPAKKTAAAAAAPGAFNIIPIALIAAAILVISLSAVFIGFTVFGGGNPPIARNSDDDPDGPVIEKDDENNRSPTPKTDVSPSVTPAGNTNNSDIIASNTDPIPNLPPGKKYLDMSDAERRQYLEARAMRVAQVIGNRSSDTIPAAAIDKIKGFADAYAKRVGVKPLGGCRFGDNLQATYERASKNAPFIVRAFNEKGIDPRIGLYLAMIESEHCVCLRSPTGPLGMFQFTFATAKLHFDPNGGVRQGATPANPDDRCLPEPSARAAASYMKALTGRYGTGPASVPLAIGSYNSGEGGLSSNLQKALDSNEGLPRDFWTLIAKGDILSKQFQAENFKYVPKFFAAAIIGENPRDFGLNLQPISTYSK
jgi:hypothetical protein